MKPSPKEELKIDKFLNYKFCDITEMAIIQRMI
jgi:hypothetical protein